MFWTGFFVVFNVFLCIILARAIITALSRSVKNQYLFFKGEKTFRPFAKRRRKKVWLSFHCWRRCREEMRTRKKKEKKGKMMKIQWERKRRRKVWGKLISINNFLFPFGRIMANTRQRKPFLLLFFWERREKQNNPRRDKRREKRFKIWNVGKNVVCIFSILMQVHRSNLASSSFKETFTVKKLRRKNIFIRMYLIFQAWIFLLRPVLINILHFQKTADGRKRKKTIGIEIYSSCPPLFC